jgi:hypothetical protein
VLGARRLDGRGIHERTIAGGSSTADSGEGG